MILFQRHGGYWLFWVGAIYLVIALSCVVWYPDVSITLVQFVWVVIMSMPLWFPPLGRWLNLDIEWDRKFMKWFNKKEEPKYIPEGLGVRGKIKERQSEEPKGTTMYSIGLTDQNRVSFRMGYSEITMNPQGVQNMIDQLELFKKQIMEESSNNAKEEQ